MLGTIDYCDADLSKPQASKNRLAPLTEKTQIINEFGADELLLPKMISEALVANDRVKYLFALIQNAKAQADNPSLEVSDLRSERSSAGVSDESPDRVPVSSSRLQDGSYLVPQVGGIFER